jgi:stage II sporulation protein AB (anti-sigma F factor)
MGSRRGFEVRLDAVPESVAAVRQALREFLGTLEMSDERSEAIVLATTEACSNAIVHAYPAGTRGRIDVSAEDGDGDVIVTVRDTGVGMAPRLDSPGLGVGLPMIAMIADGVEIDKPSTGGTHLRMRFALGAHVLPKC